MVEENLRLRMDGHVKNLNYRFSGMRRDGTTFEVGKQGSATTLLGRPAVVGVLQDVSDKSGPSAKFNATWLISSARSCEPWK